MPFELKNVAQRFHRFVNEVFNNLKFFYLYADDILVASDSLEKHKKTLKQGISTTFKI